MNILVGSSSSYKAIVIARYLKKHYPKFHLYGIAAKNIFKIIHSRYFDNIIVIGEKTKSGLVEIISNTLNTYDIDFYIPVDSTEYNTIYNNAKLLNLKQLSYFGSKESYLVLNNKQNLHLLCKKIGINVPTTFYDSIQKITVGSVVKPTSLTSSKGVLYVKNKKDLNSVIVVANTYSEFIVQDYIAGVGVGYSVFAKNGKILVGYGHRRISEFPTSGGASNYRTSYVNQEMNEIAENIIYATKWSGFAMFEFKLTKENKLFLIEVNPRIWGSINQGIQNGVNYFEYMLGKLKHNSKNKKTIHTYLAPLFFLSLVINTVKLNFKPLFFFLKNLTNSRPDVSVFNDPSGFLSMLLRKI